MLVDRHCVVSSSPPEPEEEEPPELRLRVGEGEDEGSPWEGAMLVVEWESKPDDAAAEVGKGCRGWKDGA